MIKKTWFYTWQYIKSIAGKDTNEKYVEKPKCNNYEKVLPIGPSSHAFGVNPVIGLALYAAIF